MTHKLLVIVPCGSAKVWSKYKDKGPTIAREVYIGAPFVVNRRFAETYADHWVILSAKYGFIEPDHIIAEGYEVTFKKQSTNPISYIQLAQQVREKHLYEYDRIICLGGRDYRSMVMKAFADTGVSIEFPAAGMKLGKSLQFIKHYNPRG